MGDARTHQRSFGGGEVSPEFWGRIDDVKYQTGLGTCRNFVVLPHGPVRNREGTIYVREVKDSDTRTRTLPFVYAFDQVLLIEFSVGVFRFHALGQTVLDGAVPYEVAHTYLEDELFEVRYTQSGDVLTLVHRNHPVRELRRNSAIDWELIDVAFGPTLDPPTGLASVATPGATPGTPFDTDYVVTSVTSTEDESLQSATETCSNNLYDDGAYNTVSWSAATGAIRYNVYKKSAGLFGYIGQTDQLEFKDDNIAPDLGKTPPLDITADLFDEAGDYPGAVAYQDQRRCFAASDNEPQNIWMSRAGTETNFNYSIPPQDNDSIQIKLASREANSIRHLVPMSDLIALTFSSAWRISGGISDLLTPDTVSAKQQSFVGASDARPVLAGNNMLYVAARGGHLREFGYDGDRNGYVSGDVSVRAPHLFDGYDIASMSSMVAPCPIVWAPSSSGKLIGFTYIPEQQVGAFHQHDTGPDRGPIYDDDAFEDATVLNENGQDVVYVVVRRTFSGATKRFIEYFVMTNRATLAAEDQHFVDCSGVYSGAATNVVTGADWLEGETVSILADGAVCPQQEVVAGSFELPEDVTASVIRYGLPITADIESLPLAVELQGYGQGMPKNVNEVVLRVYKSAGIFVGPQFDDLTEFKQRTDELPGDPPDLYTGSVEMVIDGKWQSDGTVCIRQTDPLAVMILSMTLDFVLGGG